MAESQSRFFHPRKLNHAERTVTTRRLRKAKFGTTQIIRSSTPLPRLRLTRPPDSAVDDCHLLQATSTVQTTGKSHGRACRAPPWISGRSAAGLSPHKILPHLRFPTQNTNNRNRDRYSSHDAKRKTNEFHRNFTKIQNRSHFQLLLFFQCVKKSPQSEKSVFCPLKNLRTILAGRPCFQNGSRANVPWRNIQMPTDLFPPKSPNAAPVPLPGA